MTRGGIWPPKVEVRADAGDTYRPGFPLSRVDNTRFIGSLFGLSPGTAYQVRVSFNDPAPAPTVPR